jgi:hypothetical protein
MEQNMPADQGGTIRYHRAHYIPGAEFPWEVWFYEDGGPIHEFTAAEGEAMGLTPPAPQATITLADGRSVTVDETVLRSLWIGWGLQTNDPRPSARISAALAPLFTDTDEATP